MLVDRSAPPLAELRRDHVDFLCRPALPRPGAGVWAATFGSTNTVLTKVVAGFYTSSTSLPVQLRHAEFLASPSIQPTIGPSGIGDSGTRQLCKQGASPRGQIVQVVVDPLLARVLF